MSTVCEKAGASARPVWLLPYWIQRADLSVTEYPPADATTVVSTFASHPWSQEVLLYRRLEAHAVECCPPGIGIVADRGRILHLCPEDEHVLLHYHYTEDRRLLAVIPWRRGVVLTALRFPLSGCGTAIRRFYAGHHQWFVNHIDGDAPPGSTVDY